MELSPLGNTSNSSLVGSHSAGEIDVLSSDGEDSIAYFGSSQDLEGMASDVKATDKQAFLKLESENETLKAHLALFRREMIRFSKEEGREGQMKAKLDQLPYLESLQQTNGLGAFHHTSQKRDKRKQRRRWSLSSAGDPERGIYPSYGKRVGDGAVVLFHDELDSHESGHGLHHRRGGDFTHNDKFQTPLREATTPPKRGVKHHSSDACYSEAEDSSSNIQETLQLLPDEEEGIMAENEDIEDQNKLFWDDVKDRAGWLVGLMVLQSLSSFIIKRNEELLEEHLVIIQFLTMLVGAGGNAGNQASVRVIRGLAIGAVTDQNVKRFLSKELFMGLLLACILAVSGCIRAAVFATPFLETMAITTSLWAIVFISIAVGALLPLGMKQVGIDPAHSSTTIQVVMDILGVTITVHVSKMFFSLAASWMNGT